MPNVTDYNPNRGFTLAEDAALKRRLSAVAVVDDRNAERIVKTYFRYPEGETEKLYPFMTLDLVDISYAGERQESEKTYYFEDAGVGGSHANTIDYYPSEFNEGDLDTQVAADSYLATDQFVPVDLLYQITTYCRSQQHDRQLTMTLMRRVFPLRRGFIDIPEDGTIRRCELLDWRNSDVLDQEAGYKKRVFRKVYTVRINAEIPQSDFMTVQQVLEVNGTLSNFDPATPDTFNPITEDF